MEIINKKLEDLKPYENNPRFNDDAVEYVANSIKEFGFRVPMIIDKDNVIVAGHTRYKAALELGLKEVPCIVADDLTDEQIKAFRLADNKVSEKSQWNFDLLEEELNDIINIDMSEFDFDLSFDDPLDKYRDKEKGALADKFGVPPFSVFDTKQGYWQDRRNLWKELGIKSETGRGENLLSFSRVVGTINNGTSIFDPVLCEICYKWFNIDGGKIFDPFAGGSVRGIVAKKLGYDYLGIDLREEQIQANKENAKEIGVNPTWYCDDSLNCDKYIEDNSCDMVFSCPPYADLEKYSDDPRDLSTMEYDDFKKVYFEIIKKSVNKLKENRFAVFVVGDVRDDNGFYINFIDDTKKGFLESGMKLYNEIILINSVGTGALRANKLFSMRKVVKMHQNVLVFYKGDAKKIKENYKEVFIDNIEEEEDV